MGKEISYRETFFYYKLVNALRAETGILPKSALFAFSFTLLVMYDLYFYTHK